MWIIMSTMPNYHVETLEYWQKLVTWCKLHNVWQHNNMLPRAQCGQNMLFTCKQRPGASTHRQQDAVEFQWSLSYASCRCVAWFPLGVKVFCSTQSHLHGEQRCVGQQQSRKQQTRLEAVHNDLQTCDYMVCNISSIVTRFNTEQTQATEEHCLGNAPKSLQHETAEKACSSARSYPAIWCHPHSNCLLYIYSKSVGCTRAVQESILIRNAQKPSGHRRGWAQLTMVYILLFECVKQK